MQEVTRAATAVAVEVADTEEAVVATEVAAVEVVVDTVDSREEVATGAEDMVSLQAPEAGAFPLFL